MVHQRSVHSVQAKVRTKKWLHSEDTQDAPLGVIQMAVAAQSKSGTR